jgi:hypothetical protein
MMPTTDVMISWNANREKATFGFLRRDISIRSLG